MTAAHSSTHKRVVIRKTDKTTVKGYVNPSGYLAAKGVEVLDLDGRLLSLALEDIKGVYFVRDFDGDAERPEKKTYLSRPKLNGMWVRMTFKDGETLDGIVSENLLEHDSRGLVATVPDANSNNQRVFIPRSALVSVQVLDVVSEEARRARAAGARPRRRPAHGASQFPLFPPRGTSDTATE